MADSTLRAPKHLGSGFDSDGRVANLDTCSFWRIVDRKVKAPLFRYLMLGLPEDLERKVWTVLR